MTRADPTFTNDVLDLFENKRGGHIGLHLYASHKGTRNGSLMSGDRLWERAAQTEPAYYIARADVELLNGSLPGLADTIPSHLPLVDLGPGSGESVLGKSVPLLTCLQSYDYQPMDISQTFLVDAVRHASRLSGVRVRAKQSDILAPDACHDYEGCVAVYFGGGTISNLVCPLAQTFPEHRLISELQRLRTFTGHGYLLLSFDSCQDEQQLMAMYGNRSLSDFALNFLYRVADEIAPVGFDPTGFVHTPLWVPGAHLLALVATATTSQHINVDGRDIHWESGQRFHIVNCFKYTETLFESCVAHSGFEIVGRWPHHTPMRQYLLRTNRSCTPRCAPDSELQVA